MTGAKPVKRSVAVLIRNGERVLALRRPDEDDELPGIWGLPAGSFREGEMLAALIGRIGREKLGAGLTPVRKLAQGAQTRPRYSLEMELWEAAIQGQPTKPPPMQWQWTSIETFKPGQAAGSLCCALAVGLA